MYLPWLRKVFGRKDTVRDVQRRLGPDEAGIWLANGLVMGFHGNPSLDPVMIRLNEITAVTIYDGPKLRLSVQSDRVEFTVILSPDLARLVLADLSRLRPDIALGYVEEPSASIPIPGIEPCTTALPEDITSDPTLARLMTYGSLHNLEALDAEGMDYSDDPLHGIRPLPDLFADPVSKNHRGSGRLEPLR